MSVRKRVKRWLYGSVPGLAGSFPYFGTRVFFPKNAYIFTIVCEEGIYEKELLRHIQAVVTAGSWYFDVGANIGLMSVPVLQSCANVHVLSFEPSPNSRPYLLKTWDNCPWKSRWKVVEKAAGDRSKSVQMSLSPRDLGGFDSIRYTERVKRAGVVTIEMTTIDAEWRALGKPPVSCMKLDVEGAELMALSGAQELIAAARPFIIMEWFEQNFKHYGCKAEDLMTTAENLNYDLFSSAHLTPISSRQILKMQLGLTASFVLIPRTPVRSLD
jgi:FkbM family methyltransferase